MTYVTSNCPWKTTWPIGIKNTRTQELNLHCWHSFNDRVKPWVQAGRVWRPSDITPIFFFFIDWNVHTQNKDKENAFWQMWSWDWDEAMECNGWTLIETMVWSNENGNDRRCLKRIRKSTQKLDPHMVFNGRVANMPGYKRDVCDALVTSRPGY